MHMNQQDPHPAEAVKTIFLREKERLERINNARAASEKRLAQARMDALAALAAAEKAGAAAGRREYEQITGIPVHEAVAHEHAKSLGLGVLSHRGWRHPPRLPGQSRGS